MTPAEFNALPEARLSKLKAGDVLVADAGFVTGPGDNDRCIEPWTDHVVKQDKDGLFVECAVGHHYLDGQQSHDKWGLLVGFRMKT